MENISKVLHEEEKKYRALLERGKVILLVNDQEMNIKFACNYAYEILQVPNEEIEKHHLSRYID